MDRIDHRGTVPVAAIAVLVTTMWLALAPAPAAPGAPVPDTPAGRPLAWLTDGPAHLPLPDDDVRAHVVPQAPPSVTAQLNAALGAAAAAGPVRLARLVAAFPLTLRA